MSLRFLTALFDALVDLKKTCKRDMDILLTLLNYLGWVSLIQTQ